MELTKRIIVKDDFSDFSFDSLGPGSSATVLPNGIIKIESVVSSPGWIQKQFAAEKFSVIEMSCIARVENAGQEARLAINLSETTTPHNQDYASVLSVRWRPYMVRFPVKPNFVNAWVTLGFWSGYAGTAYFRDVIIKVYNGELAQ